MKYCSICGAEIFDEAEICPKCGVRIKKKSQGSPGLAAVLSFIWGGLGQIYNGQIGKGLLLMIVIFITAITIIGLIIAIPLWLYSIFDAYEVAKGK